ncbi:LVIVD repeat-containing protein [Polynucleobacter necessarius]|uniref:LVIVD repeat-containing protein n=1 Tax=Polynucleobacter necessarius TaxID=576610 RepID=UPI0018D577F5|nr:hypothetical protein [Polynucleobacter necessarius]
MRLVAGGIPELEVGDPEPEPTRLPKQFETGFRAHNTNVFPQRPDRAYIGYIDGGAFVLDISDKSNIKVVSKWNHSPPFNGFIHTVLPLFDRGLWIVSDECVLDNGADWPKLVRVLDARQEGNPAPIGTFPAPSYKAFAKRGGRFWAHNLHENLPGPCSFVSDHIIIGTFFNAGVRVYDTTNPLRLRRLLAMFPAPLSCAHLEQFN